MPQQPKSLQIAQIVRSCKPDNMNTTSHGKLAHKAWWSASLAEFSLQPDKNIVEQLAYRLVESHPLNHATQLQAWQKQLEILRATMRTMPLHWQLLLEYPLLRLGKRLDTVLLTDNAIFAIEFKAGAHKFESADLRQAEDYALDLQDFHTGSRDKLIIPILVATKANAAQALWPLLWHGVMPPFAASAVSFSSLLTDILERIPENKIDLKNWEQSPYRPVPTIVEAATMLYAKHNVSEIAAARADVTNLTRTTQIILNTITKAQSSNAHIIIFVTGIPGAGKTLCGLNAVFGANTGAAFLTGNLPLVHVLREALARDASQNSKTTIGQARHKTESAIQGLTGFVRDNIGRTAPPHEHVVVFDEAQRAWDAAYGARKFNLHDSEAALFLDIMNKHSDYAVIVALVGNGQEINTGEAGLGEWGRALAQRPNWQVYAAPNVLAATEPRQQLFKIAPKTIGLDDALHLNTSVRSVRSSTASPWVDAVLRGARDEAQQIAQNNAPFYITRSLNDLRLALRTSARGERRSGLVCSTGARRLVADGIWPDFPHLDNKAIANWFLNRWPDVRASNALEIPATQFACQGLELDYVGLCWGGDLIWQNGWQARKFSGTKWQIPTNPDAFDFRINTYRVLLTRARYETIIWVPEGDPADPTRAPQFLDETAAYLLACGARTIDKNTALVITPVSVATPQGSLI